jgi:hypothetical protein
MLSENPEDTTPMIIPVGHFCGVFASDDRSRSWYEVRLGTKVHELSALEFVVWTITHGTGDLVLAKRWTRAVVEEQARAKGVPRPDVIVDDLVGRRLLATAVPHAALAGHFAQSHRLVPLMTGMGNSTSRPEVFGIGTGGVEIVHVGPSLYLLWSVAGATNSLMEACEAVTDARATSAAAQTAVGLAPTDSNGGKHLEGLLAQAHVLLSVNAAYFDLCLAS